MLDQDPNHVRLILYPNRQNVHAINTSHNAISQAMPSLDDKCKIGYEATAGHFEQPKDSSQDVCS